MIIATERPRHSQRFDICFRGRPNSERRLLLLLLMTRLLENDCFKRCCISWTSVYFYYYFRPTFQPFSARACQSRPKRPLLSDIDVPHALGVSFLFPPFLSKLLFFHVFSSSLFPIFSFLFCCTRDMDDTTIALRVVSIVCIFLFFFCLPVSWALLSLVYLV